MLPVLQVGPLSIQTYPLGLLLAAWTALVVAAWAAPRCRLDRDHVYNVGLYGLVAGLVVARAAHVVAFWPAYRTQLLEIFGFNTTAFLPWPGLLGGMAVAGWYVYRHRLAPARIADALAPGVLVGMAVVSLAALLAGRAYGAQASVPWAVSLWGVLRHPSQVYEALAALAVAGLVLRMIAQGSRPGAAAWVALAGAGLARWLLEPFRAESTIVLGGLRVAQLVGLAVALLALWRLAARQRTASPPE